MRTKGLLHLTRCTLKCSKHFHQELIATHGTRYAAAIQLERRDNANRDQRTPAAMVGRTRRRRSGAQGSSPHLQLGRTRDRRRDLPVATAWVFTAAHAKSDCILATRIWDEPRRNGEEILAVSPVERWEAAVPPNLGKAGRGSVKELAAADVRHMPERRSAKSSGRNTSAKEISGFRNENSPGTGFKKGFW
jgi:hypothetical protein